MSTFNLGVVAPTHKGAYNIETAYKARNIVSYNGGAYMAKQDCQGVSPESTEYWGLIAEAGQGGPINYAGTLSNLQADNMVDKTKVHLIANENDTNYFGHVVFWNGSAWIDGGEYAGVKDNSISIEKTNFYSLEDNLWYLENSNEYVTYDKETGVTSFSANGNVFIAFEMFLEAGTYHCYYYDKTMNLPRMILEGKEVSYSKDLGHNGSYEITESGIYRIRVGSRSSVISAKIYFGKNEYPVEFVKAQFTNKTLVLSKNNIPNKLISSEMLNDELYESIKMPNKLYGIGILATNSHENLSYTNSATGFYLINKNLIENGRCLNKIVFYGVVNKVISFYLVHKISNNEYEVIGEKYQTAIGPDNKSEYVFNIDLSKYDNIYFVTNNCSYNSSFPGATGFSNVGLSDNIFTEGTKHSNWEMYVDIYMADYKMFDDITYSDDINSINKRVFNVPRTLNSDYVKNLKNVVTEKFLNFNDNFSGNNSVTSENGLVCSDYTKTYYNKGTAIDLVRIVSKFRYSENSKFGLYLGNILGYVDTTDKTLNLCGGYGQANIIPGVSASESISFDFVNGNDYIIELIKNAMDYTLKITDSATMTVVSTSYHVANSGLGVPGIVSFSGNILCTEFKYYLPNYSYAKTLFLGDSVTEGVGVTDLTKRWCYQLMSKYFSNDGVIAGVGGNTTAQGLTRLNEILNLGYEFEYVIIFFGLNDMRNGGSVENWKTNITALREKIVDCGAKPIICVPQLLGGSYTASFEAARDFVLEQGWDCIRFDLTGLIDLHPNDEGHNLMYEIACKSLDTII